MKKEIKEYFQIYGPCDVPRKGGITDRTIDPQNRKAFWNVVEEEYPGLREAGGCYVFGLRSEKKGTETPWYIGMAEKQTFEQECFQDHKLKRYAEAMNISGNRSSTPIMYFVARCMRQRQGFAKIPKNDNKAIRVVEKNLIALGVRSNLKLLNVRDANVLKGLSVEGLHHSRNRGRRSRPTNCLRDMFQVTGRNAF